MRSVWVRPNCGMTCLPSPACIGPCRRIPYPFPGKLPYHGLSILRSLFLRAKASTRAPGRVASGQDGLPSRRSALCVSSRIPRHVCLQAISRDQLRKVAKLPKDKVANACYQPSRWREPEGTRTFSAGGGPEILLPES